MKYLKLYESFNTDLEDILLEITDIGYFYDIVEEYDENYIMITNKTSAIYLSGIPDKPLINFPEIKDCVLRLKSYLGDKYTKSEIYNSNQKDKLNLEIIDLNENTIINSKFMVFYVCWIN